MKFTIPGNPLPQARHRIAKRGKFTMMYDPQAEDKKIVANRVLWQIKQLIGEGVKEASNLPYSEGISINLCVYMPIAKSDSQTQKNLKIWGVIANIKHKDGDNFFKFYTDACNKILYKDDSQIVKGYFEKRYSDNPRTEITIVPLESKVSKEVESVLGIYGPDELRDLCENMETIQHLVYGLRGNSNFSIDADAVDLVANLIDLAKTHGPLFQKINKIKAVTTDATKAKK